LLSTGAYYVGRSRLGVGTALDLHQGAYLQTNAGASTQLGRFTVSLDATNLLNERRNIFALGDPFGVAQGLQRTPLRPRTIRLGTSIAF
jgi:outer membrane receptor protein involved in Fe transport